MDRLLIVCAIAATVSLAPASQPEKPGEPKAAVFFPTKVGATRVWAWVGDKNDFTEVVTKVRDKDGVTFVMVAKKSGDYAATDEYAIYDKGLFQVSHDQYGFDPPRCILKAPYRKGTKWEVDTKDQFGLRQQTANTIGDYELIEVPAGKFMALRVDIEHAGEKPRRTATRWYAPGVGEVKMVARSKDGTEGTVVLKSFTPGKD